MYWLIYIREYEHTYVDICFIQIKLAFKRWKDGENTNLLFLAEIFACGVFGVCVFVLNMKVDLNPEKFVSSSSIGLCAKIQPIHLQFRDPCWRLVAVFCAWDHQHWYCVATEHVPRAIAKHSTIGIYAHNVKSLCVFSIMVRMSTSGVCTQLYNCVVCVYTIAHGA